jgi:hypothetical protein
VTAESVEELLDHPLTLSLTKPMAFHAAAVDSHERR